MSRFLAVVSGKGGVGKTTTSINLAFCLKDHCKTVLVDGNLGNPHIGLHFGKQNPEFNIHRATLLNHPVAKAIHDIYGMNVVMGGFGSKYNYAKIKTAIKGLCDFGDIIVVDCPPGEYMHILEHCDECIIVTTPDAVAVGESHLAKAIAKKLSVDVLGVVVNKVSNARHELKLKQIEAFLSLPILAEIPEDINIQKALKKMQPVVHYSSMAKSSKEFIKLAKLLK